MEILAAIDPVTRLEGHLKVEITVDTVDGVQQVVDVKAGGNLFRAFENILVGRDPRDAQHITERICGVCPVAHGMASVLTQDAAFGVTIPNNARVMRNMVLGANFVESHILHFYLLSLPDFIAGPPLPPWKPEWQMDRRFSKEENGTLVGGYLQAVAMRRRAHELGALFGGKLPHPPSFLAGGITATPRQERLDAIKAHLDVLIPFVRDVYIRDVETVAAKYSDYFSIGRGPGNLLAFGVFDLNAAGTTNFLARGLARGGSRTIEALDPAKITEQVTSSWYSDVTNDLNPASGQTIGENPKTGAYSWLKAPRYEGLAFEVGPLARMWATGDYRNGISTMDRHLARAYEALKVATAMRAWVDQIDPAGPVYTAPTLPQTASGMGLTEAPRGALGHWMSVAGGVISRYQVISPTTWNLSPRGMGGELGPVEQALLGVRVRNAEEPIEVLRVIHSADPCLDCAAHVMRPGGPVTVVRTGVC